MPPRFTYRNRALCARFEERSLDALLVTHLPNVAYLTGLRSTAGVALVTPGGSQLFVDSRYLTAAESLTSDEPRPELAVTLVQGSYEETVGRALVGLGRSRVGVESDHMSLSRWMWFQEHLKAGEVSLEPCSGLVETQRIVKDSYEISCFRAAGQLIAEAVARVLETVRPGETELDTATEIDRIMSRCGFEDRAFPTIVASGPNSALPHAHPSGRRIVAGDLVLMDFGGVLNGYCVDVSRTVCMSPVGDEAARLHAAVLEAQQDAVAAVRPGLVASQIDAAARSTLARRGLAEAFGHGTGHGLGLEVHEAPRVGRAGQEGTDVCIQSGMVFTVEPGVYLPGVGGVRIEDDILVTDQGCEVLTDAPRGLRVSG